MMYSNNLIFSLKRSVFTVILLFCFTVNFSQDITVDFEGKVTHETAVISEVIVQVLQNGKLLTSFHTGTDGNYNVYLPLGFDYVISLSKNNYVTKHYSVSTKDIPADHSATKFPTIRADVELFKYYEGVDYSLFNEPISKFYYNSKKRNFDYDKDMLKEKQAGMKKIKMAENDAILLALEKNAAEQKELERLHGKKEMADRLAEEKKILDEKLAKQSLLLKLIEDDKKTILKASEENEINLNIVAADNDASKKIIDKKINDLITKYKQGVTEEKEIYSNIIIIKRVVVREEEIWVYEKKIFNWGGIAYFRDKQRITESTFKTETENLNK